ncbi:hypothetical protein SAMN05421759_10827 [Roseivivax lentus]|uniref:Uncharacterized protein n=1 Tax=Roseivivax lentus TaxID=633194 RepID=A0A1N7NFE4_9RHOB|nr:hypothetical protein [Roseivivax lentus]SIS96899.1 hypothetical protein SAMN05421759_10827 [Roseivivax lentus]
MKAMILGFAAIAVISVGAWYGLNVWGFSAADTTSSPSAVRVGDAGPSNPTLRLSD